MSDQMVMNICSISINNKYTKWYTNIIVNATNRTTLLEKFEVHHIVPRSLGGTNHIDNLVKLTVREHVICHILLCKMVVGQQKYKMLHAVNIMCNKTVRVNSRIVEGLRQERKQSLSGAGNPNFGKTWDAETKQKIGTAMRGKTHTANTRVLMSQKQHGENNPMFGKKQEVKSVELMSIKQQANRKLKIKCATCNKEVDKQNYARWHGNKCNNTEKE
jgi:hypothetical protein